MACGTRLCIPQAIHAYWRRAGHSGLSRIRSPPFTLPTDEEGGRDISEKPRADMLTPVWNAERFSARRVFKTRSPFFALPAPGHMSKPRVDALTFHKGLCVHGYESPCLPCRRLVSLRHCRL